MNKLTAHNIRDILTSVISSKHNQANVMVCSRATHLGRDLIKGEVGIVIHPSSLRGEDFGAVCVYIQTGPVLHQIGGSILELNDLPATVAAILA